MRGLEPAEVGIHIPEPTALEKLERVCSAPTPEKFRREVQTLLGDDISWLLSSRESSDHQKRFQAAVDRLFSNAGREFNVLFFIILLRFSGGLYSAFRMISQKSEDERNFYAMMFIGLIVEAGVSWGIVFCGLLGPVPILPRTDLNRYLLVNDSVGELYKLERANNNQKNFSCAMAVFLLLSLVLSLAVMDNKKFSLFLGVMLGDQVVSVVASEIVGLNYWSRFSFFGNTARVTEDFYLESASENHNQGPSLNAPR